LRSEQPEEGDPLAAIIESRRASDSQGTTTGVEAALERPPSLTSQLPILVIIQYGLLALHSTTHDQVFLSYLVSSVIPILPRFAFPDCHSPEIINPEVLILMRETSRN
jgi:hypothetical protein